MSSQKYLCLQASDAGQTRGPSPSAADMQRMYEAFDAWRQKFASNIVDLGGRLTGPTTIGTHAGTLMAPPSQAREVFGGYMILSAATLDEAVEIAKACPGVVGPGSRVVVREIGA